ncbi:carboxypeptidase regulatory-like domain-containing protein [Streptomyces sp. ISL-22]|uniref:carboxypeptidase regulatory-like domain-containing protein n=1 Tax=unclassified Streptomyces TaxID=2593676 RepID=UPI001BEB2B30|nr:MULTISPECIES: carboxypeptidase regulatory-like domain-containing protein [unclassified Streptomyces]MBT2418597.1 carboxypeptidase regulatory-like domain-containing protein [Streptomyces sp. ISL-24]MBT2434300.1 carboxypeptidase regulatory-like domain-containing protein [Streptomyces sp. ISL-22]
MSTSWKTTIFGSLAVAGVLVMSGMAYGGEGPAGGDLWAAATIEPGREGIVEVGGYEGAPLGAGSVLTLTAPANARVTGTPFAAGGYRGSVALGGGSGTYTFTGAPGADGKPTPGAWKGRTFPFVLSVSRDAEPGTRLPDCTLVLKDAKGTVRQWGTCTVTVGLPAPTLSHPQSGVPLGALPKASGTAYPGAQITVRDAREEEVCTTTTAPAGTWSCTPALPLPPGPGRLQATATLNGVSATSEQIDITVEASAGAQPDTVSDSGGGRL